MLKAVILSLMLPLAASSALADNATPPPNLPPQDGVKLSTVVAGVEQRPGFYAVGSITYDSGDYAVVYFMKDGGEVHINFDAKTGAPKPPKKGLFGN